MGVLSSRLVVSLTNSLSGPARGVVASLKGMQAAGSAAATGITGAANAARTQGRQLNRAVRGMNNASMGAMGASVAAGAFLASEMRVQEAMNRTRAILNITDEDSFKPHRDLVIELGKQYPATSSAIAEGASELAMAGMTMQQVNEVLEATVQGSMASGESIKTVGMGVTDVVMGLGKELTKANFAEVNDTLAAGATSYAQDYSAFLAGLAKTAPLARVTNTSLADTVSMLGILANAGFKAEKGGTALRTMMINLGAPTNAGLGALSRYNIALEEFRGQLDRTKIGGAAGAQSLQKALAEQGIFADLDAGALQAILDDQSLDAGALRAALGARIASSLEEGGAMVDAEAIQDVVGAFVASGFTNLDVLGLFRRLGETGAMNDIGALKDIFGKRFAAQASSIMAAMNTPAGDSNAYDSASDAFKGRISGAVDRFSKILMSGLPGAVKRLAGAFDALMRTMANSGAIDTVVNALDGLRDVINGMAETSPALLEALTLGLIGLGAVAPIAFTISTVASAFTVLTSAGGLLMATLSPLGVALAGIAAAGYWIYQNWQGIGEFMTGVGQGFMEGLGPARPLVEGLASGLGAMLGWLGDMLGPLDASGEAWRSWGEMVGNVLSAPLRLIGNLIDMIGQLGALLTDSSISEAFDALAGWFGGDEGEGEDSADAPATPSRPGGAARREKRKAKDGEKSRAAAYARAEAATPTRGGMAGPGVAASPAPARDVNVTVNIPGGAAHDPDAIGLAAGKGVRDALDEGFSDGGM